MKSKQAVNYGASGFLLTIVGSSTGAIATNSHNTTLRAVGIAAGLIGALLMGISIGIQKKEK